ncbi:multiple sugar transport system permease protein/putative chitobiose transport system permease protein [Evansella vedderi]|uniref:Multiple sugar transport system permease protein/putative chitobiose transport system permease protein n=1 Tax=Evansella vedderi TaxID=38282 RepID=A0ABT9ZP02_9BACI|nr:carbohydrate ABC transporter permease [Evansella vedderi]MDQ0252952.1 multiple sugar transport system permease protein/putative chitobiose transport system permease protein [Evansella vedderi]
MNKRSRNPWLIYFIHVLIAAIVILPLAFGFVSSFRHLDDIFRYMSPVTWKTFIPTNLTLEAYVNLFSIRGFGRVLFNTFFVTTLTVIFGLFVCSLAAFGLSVFNFKGRNIIFVIVLLTFMIPEESIAIPLYRLVDSLGWINTYYALIVPGIANGLVIFLYRQFFMDIPKPLLEAARMDGASWFKIYWSIVMPLSKPVTVTASLLIFIQQWESFMWPLIATRTQEYRVIQVALSHLRTETGTYWNELFAAALISVIIPVLILLPLQRYFVQGITNTSTKD